MWVCGLDQDRDRWSTLLSVVMNLRVQRNAGNFLTSWKPVSCSGRTLHHGVSKEMGRQGMNDDDDTMDNLKHIWPSTFTKLHNCIFQSKLTIINDTLHTVLLLHPALVNHRTGPGKRLHAL